MGFPCRLENGAHHDVYPLEHKPRRKDRTVVVGMGMLPWSNNDHQVNLTVAVPTHRRYLWPSALIYHDP